jgi:hypothetical protein
MVEGFKIVTVAIVLHDADETAVFIRCARHAQHAVKVGDVVDMPAVLFGSASNLQVEPSVQVSNSLPSGFAGDDEGLIE